MSTGNLAVPGLAPPPIARRFGELRALREPLRMFAKAGDLINRRADNPKQVVVVPGLGAGDRGVAPLRGYLSRLGHSTHTWRLGTHRRNLLDTLPRFERRLEDVVATAGESVALVGWSLGGVVARETARDRPDLVSMVVTYGSPLHGPRYTVASRIYRPSEHRIVDDFITSRGHRPITVPVSAIYSKRDGVVDWASCVDLATEQAENLEVTSTHLGMSFDPDVWGIVADRLNRPLDQANGSIR